MKNPEIHTHPSTKTQLLEYFPQYLTAFLALLMVLAVNLFGIGCSGGRGTVAPDAPETLQKFSGDNDLKHYFDYQPPVENHPGPTSEMGSATTSATNTSEKAEPTEADIYAVNGDYLGNGQWDAAFAMPAAPGNYELVTYLYCGVDEAYCASRYGIAAQVTDNADFSISNQDNATNAAADIAAP